MITNYPSRFIASIALCIICMTGLSLFAQDTQNNDRTETDAHRQLQPETVTMPFSEKSFRATTSPVTVITGEELARFPTSNVLEALNGLIPSLSAFTNGNEPGNMQVVIRIKNLPYNVYVDGVERPLNDLDVNEIESISILRGITARAMFGNAVENGAIVVNTKKGMTSEGRIRVNVEQGVKNATHMPDWLNAYEYAQLHNQASLNDGLTPRYSSNDLNAYLSRTDPIRYPDENLFGEIFNPSMGYTRANMDFSGAYENVLYFLYMGYTSEGNNYGKIKDTNSDRFNLRANVEMNVTERTRLSLGANGGLKSGHMFPNETQMWSALQSYAPNVFPLRIAPDTFGTNQSFPHNPVADQLMLGDIEQISHIAQTNLGLHVNLDEITQGLKFSSMLAYSTYNYQTKSYKHGLQYIKYQPSYSDINPDSLILTPIGTDVPVAGSSITSTNHYLQWTGNLNLGYDRVFGMHHVSSQLVYSLKQQSFRGAAQDDKIQNLGLSGSYAYDQKYHVDMVLSYTGSMNLPKEKRFGLFPSVGLSWIASKEDFLQNSKLIDFLKLRGEYGTMGFVNAGNYFLYRTEWNRTGNIFFGSVSGNQSETISTTYLSQTGNPNLSWATVTDMNIGIDAALMNSRLGVELNAYQMVKDGIIGQSIVPSVLGATNLWNNYNKYRYYGLDGGLSWKDKLSEFFYAISANFGINRSEILKYNDITYEYDWLNRVGNPVDGIYGLESIGIFSNEAELTNSPSQNLGETFVGNIRYRDLNGDGKIDNQIDRTLIGNSNPIYTLGMNIQLKYKNFGLYLLAVGYAGYDINVRTNPYFYARGDQKYSTYVRDNAWSNGGANPILSTGTHPNDNTNSSHWLKDGSFLKLKNVELSYTLNPNILFTNARIFMRGTNIFTTTSIENLDPENMLGGISTYPSMQTFTGGFSILF